jgi:hypothetical protein
MGNPITFTVWLSRQKPKARIPREDRETATSFTMQRSLTISRHFEQRRVVRLTPKRHERD